MRPVARSITSSRTWSRRIPRRSGGSFALSSSGKTNVNAISRLLHHEKHEDWPQIFFASWFNSAFQFSCAWKRFPVTFFDSSDARKTKTSVTSAGFAHSDGSSSGSAARCIVVLLFSGYTQLSRAAVYFNSEGDGCGGHLIREWELIVGLNS